MKILFDETGTVEGLEKVLNQATAEKIEGLMIFSCDANEFSPEKIDKILKNISVPVFGGIFPEIIFENRKYAKGTSLLVLQDHQINIQVIENMSDEQTDIAQEIQNSSTEEFKTMFVYVDAFSTSIETLISELYYEFGLENNFIGGGAGSLSFVQKPVIFTNKGLLQDAAVLASVQCNSAIGVKHGWNKVAGPFQITKSNKNTVEELDYKPAFEVYKEVVEAHSGQKFSDENFFDIAKAYPFGVSKLGSENVVRDPISMENGALVCVGNVTTDDYVDILNGDVDTLINAAGEAASKAFEQSSEHNVIVFIDCISRVLFLQDDFQKELDIVSNQNKQMIGALTLGEIANTGQDYLEFYNKTAVVGTF